MTVVKTYHDLNVWQKGHELCATVYKATQTFPPAEQFGLTSQMRRAAISIPSNIVEGFERCSNKEFKQFLVIARGSTGELQAQTDIARDLEYLTQNHYEEIASQLVEVHKMINVFIKAIR